MKPWTSTLVRNAAIAAAAGSIACLGAACSGTSSSVFGEDGDGSGGASATGAGPSGTTTGAPATTGTEATSTTTATTTVGPGGPSSSSQGGGGGGTPCGSGPDEDADGDGFTPAGGDCNDCDDAVSPDASEVGGNGTDDDCDGVVDEVASCDAGLPIANGDPLSAAQAIGLCATAANDGYGVVSARWIRADGSAANQGLQGGVLEAFGPNVPPLEGDRVLALSSGHARLPEQAGECGSASCTASGGNPPSPAFPQSVPGCPASESIISDDIGLEVTLRAPETATGYRYRFRFYSFEFPEYVCTSFNDQFVALAEPAPSGASDGNLSFEGVYPLSVNVPIDACTTCEPWAQNCLLSPEPGVMCPPVPSPCCPEGGDALEGTGFDVWTTEGAGATTWLETRAPITGGQEVTLQFIIWDTGDSALDSTVVLDDFAWLSGDDVVVETVPVE